MEARPVSSSVVLGPDLIRPNDVPHLWILRAERKDRWPSLHVFDYEWQSERLIDFKSPRVLLFAHDYEQDFGEREIDSKINKVGIFSYLRFGAAMLYLPEGSNGNLEVIMEPREANDYQKMAAEIQDRLKSGELGGDVVVNANGKQITLNISVATSEEPRLCTIARYSGEFWLSVMLDGKQL
jgi:hypothetical protein